MGFSKIGTNLGRFKSMTGKLIIIGVGPGDPELLTVKAARHIASAEVVAYFCASSCAGRAFATAETYIAAHSQKLRFTYPFTTGVAVSDARYTREMSAFYDDCAQDIALHLDLGRDVALLCEGDPFFYGSAMYLHDRLATRYVSEIVPGVAGMSGCWSAAILPMVHGDDILTVLPCTLTEARLKNFVQTGDAFVFMKLGRNMPKLRRVLSQTGLAAMAVYVEHGSRPQQRVLPFLEAPERAPYFSMVLLPGRKRVR